MIFRLPSKAPPREDDRPHRIEAAARADSLRDAGQFAAAAAAYAEALALLPERNDLRVQLGNMLKDSGRYDEAEAAYRAALKVEPGNSDIHLQLGRALKLAGRTEDAISALRDAITVAPDLDVAADELDRLLPLTEAIGSSFSRLRSGIDVSRANYVAGWALDPRRVADPVRLEVEIDGLLYQHLRTSLDRGDLKRIAPEVLGGGFEFLLPPGQGTVQVAILHDGVHLRGSPFEAELVAPDAMPRLVHRLPAPERAKPGTRPPVAIIVPVYEAADEVAICLQTLLAHTTYPARLIVIDDASPGPAVQRCLSRLPERPDIIVIRNLQNLGYTATVNRGIELAGDADVVLLNSDTAVGPRWLENLVVAAGSADDIASVTAASDNAGAFTVPEMDAVTDRPAGLSLGDYQRLVMQRSGRYWPEVPTGGGFCLYLRRAALDEIGTFDVAAFPRAYGEENDWCMRALRAGWRHIIDDRTLVHHERSASFGAAKTELMAAGRRIVDERYPEYGSLIARFHTSPGLNGARHRVRRLHRDAGVESPVVRPRALFVISTETGGTPLTNRDLMEAVSGAYEPWLLTCNAREMLLFRVGTGESGTNELVATRPLAEPLSLVQHTSRQYDETAAAWLVDYAIEIVHIRHLAFHSLNLPAVAQGLSIPVVLSFHDFYTVCPTVKLLDETLTFCGGRCTASDGDCRPELWRLDSRLPIKHRWIKKWREAVGAALDSCDAFVTTSESARVILVEAYPDLERRQFEVIPHGRDFAEMIPPSPPNGPLASLQILVPGNISPAKGRDLIEALAGRDEAGRLRFHLLGEVYPPLEGPGIIVHGTYQREQFARRALATGAHIGAVFSVWSETYCHTLTEMWAIGLPVACFNFGAVAERMQAHGAGWILPHQDVNDLYQALVAIADDPEEIGRKAIAVAAWQASEGTWNTCAKMAGHYLSLYGKIRAARRTFPVPPPSPRCRTS
jgi:GT2 family glycosyltransferase